MLFWISTALVCLVLLWSAGIYTFSPTAMAGFRDLGFPDFFRWQLVVLMVLAAVVLLLPGLPLPAKEWAYAGTGLFFLTAFVAHVVHGDPWLLSSLNLVFIGLLAISRAMYVS